MTDEPAALVERAENLKRIGNFIRVRRGQLGISQSGLADRLGRTQAFVSRLEGGKRRLSTETLERLACELRIEFRISQDGIKAWALGNFGTAEAISKVEVTTLDMGLPDTPEPR